MTADNGNGDSNNPTVPDAVPSNSTIDRDEVTAVYPGSTRKPTDQNIVVPSNDDDIPESKRQTSHPPPSELPSGMLPPASKSGSLRAIVPDFSPPRARKRGGESDSQTNLPSVLAPVTQEDSEPPPTPMDSPKARRQGPPPEPRTGNREVLNASTRTTQASLHAPTPVTPAEEKLTSAKVVDYGIEPARMLPPGTILDQDMTVHVKVLVYTHGGVRIDHESIRNAPEVVHDHLTSVVRGMVFKPAMRGNTPIEGEIEFNLNFKKNLIRKMPVPAPPPLPAPEAKPEPSAVTVALAPVTPPAPELISIAEAEQATLRDLDARHVLDDRKADAETVRRHQHPKPVHKKSFWNSPVLWGVALAVVALISIWALKSLRKYEASTMPISDEFDDLSKSYNVSPKALKRFFDIDDAAHVTLAQFAQNKLERKLCLQKEGQKRNPDGSVDLSAAKGTIYPIKTHPNCPKQP